VSFSFFFYQFALIGGALGGLPCDEHKIAKRQEIAREIAFIFQLFSFPKSRGKVDFPLQGKSPLVWRREELVGWLVGWSKNPARDGKVEKSFWLRKGKVFFNLFFVLVGACDRIVFFFFFLFIYYIGIFTLFHTQHLFTHNTIRFG
jgi:hypothetical protein